MLVLFRALYRRPNHQTDTSFLTMPLSTSDGSIPILMMCVAADRDALLELSLLLEKVVARLCKAINGWVKHHGECIGMILILAMTSVRVGMLFQPFWWSGSSKHLPNVQLAPVTLNESYLLVIKHLHHLHHLNHQKPFTRIVGHEIHHDCKA